MLSSRRVSDGRDDAVGNAANGAIQAMVMIAAPASCRHMFSPRPRRLAADGCIAVHSGGGGLDKRDCMKSTDISRLRHEPGKPRGVLRQRLDAGAFRHQRLLPAPGLADWVEHFWQVDWQLEEGSPQQQETLPHPSVHLVIEPEEAAIHGVHTGRYVRQLCGDSYAFGIKFRPGGFQPFLRGDISTLTNRSLPVASVLGEAGDAWVKAIRAASDFSARVALAGRFLDDRRPGPDPKVAQAAACVARIAAEPAITSVERFIVEGGLGKRALQRLFKHYVGVGPKWVINRYRLHEAVARIQAGEAVDWSELALELGYFDQAHFIRDFRALVGMTPGDFARRETAG